MAFNRLLALLLYKYKVSPGFLFTVTGGLKLLVISFYRIACDDLA